ncbi:conserved Plasmodium protein, unknown function [Plasmodium gallinaceum]|uniref:Oocyst capsule protein n=1 Tax=Plasmodium gallinaceum TaxID=5849 RepID=A0A1J1H088_PLAGA|nr:conserved Plasmodium protein, unknown function [Plasmodium gallinaceum]CRG98161.1 conserved Plasmodium protein, unknown function [Plasmodium gallinaceum]
MVIFFLGYFLVCFIGIENETILGKSIISFNNLNEKKILKYYSSNSDSCYFWYYLKEDFFEVLYLKNDIKKKQKSKKIKKNKGKWITTNNICSNEILIFLNKHKTFCKSISSYIVGVNKKNEQKKRIFVEYIVTDHIFMTNNYIFTYVNEKYKQIIFVISDNKKKICSKSNFFKVYFDKQYIKYAQVKYVKGEYVLLIDTKEKAGITKLFIVLHNKCKNIFFFVIIFIYELLLLLPDKLEFPEESTVKLVLKKRDNVIDNNCLYIFHKNGYNLKKSVDIKKITEQHLLKYNQKNIIKKNIDHINLMKCLEINYITNFKSKYKIEPNKNYDILSNEIIKIKKNINERTLKIVVKNIESKQDFSSIIYIYKVKEVNVNCFYPIYQSKYKDNFLLSEKNNFYEKNIIHEEIYKLRNHYYYKNNYYFDNYYIKNYFINNIKGKHNINLILGRRYLCVTQLYNEYNRKLYNINNNKNNKYKWNLSLNKNNFNIFTLYKDNENLVNYYITIYKGINSFYFFYNGYKKIHKEIIISNTLICYIKGYFIMTTLFIVPDEKIYYICQGGYKNKYVVKIIKKYNFLNIVVNENSIEIKKKKLHINNNKKDHINNKNKLNYIILSFCDEYDFNNCFISKIYILEKISDYSIIVEKNFIETNEVTNIYIFMNYNIKNLDFSNKLAFIKKKKKSYLSNCIMRKEKIFFLERIKCFPKNFFLFPFFLYNTSRKKRKLVKITKKEYLKTKEDINNTSIKLNICFHKINNDFLINYDKDSIEIKFFHNFPNLQKKYKDACAFIQIKGKRESSALIQMKYIKNKKLSKSIIVQIYKKVKILFCQDFVCSKFIKFNQMSNLLLYDGFNGVPYKINIFTETNTKELFIIENKFLNENYSGNITLFKNLFIAENFFTIFEHFSQKVIYKNIFNNDVFYENITHYPVKLYNRKLYEYEFTYDYLLLNEKHKKKKKSDINKIKLSNYYNYNNIYKNYRDEINYYDIYFHIKKHYIIYCIPNKNKHIKSNIIVEMININKPEIYSKNYFSIHFKYPSSMHITIFDKNVKNLNVLNESYISLYKNNDYYFKAFLIDENENVILTNETFQYTLEPYLLDLHKKCFKNKSNYLEIEQIKRKNIINTNNKILLNYNNKNENYIQHNKNYFNDLDNFKNSTNSMFLLSIKYNYKNDNHFDYFEKYLFLNFYDKIYTNYDNLILFYSKYIYYKIFICNISSKNLYYSFKGDKKIQIYNNYIDEEKLCYNKKKFCNIVNLNYDNHLKKCTPIYVSSKYLVDGTLTIKNKMIYETDHLDIKLIFSKISNVKISMLSKDAEINQLVPLRIEFFNEYNKKFQYIHIKDLKIKLFCDYNKIHINYIDFHLKENYKILNEIKNKFQISDVLSDLFYYLYCYIPNKYYIQIEVIYKLHNKYISILSNTLELVIYSRGVLFNERSILLYPFNQTTELSFRFDHPLISKVLCLSKNDSVVKVQKVLKIDERNKYICLIKTENIGKSEIHIYPIFESYYDIFPRRNSIPLEKFDLDFYEIEKYYLNYYKYKTKNYNYIEEKEIRNLYFFKIDVTTDYVNTIKLFHNDTIYLPLKQELNIYPKFYNDLKNKFAFIDFSTLNNNNNNNCNSYKLEYFANNKNIMLNNKIENTENNILKEINSLKKKECKNLLYIKYENTEKKRIKKKKTITKHLISSSDSFLSIKGNKEGNYLLYVNFICDNNIINSQVYNIYVKNNFKNNNITVIYLSTNGLYKFHQNFRYLNIYSKKYPLSTIKKIYTEEKENEHLIYFSDKQKKINKKIKIHISDIIGAKINNYYSKYIPLNVIQYFHIDLYNRNIESVLFPLNAKLFLNISHSSILSAKIINKNHIFIIPHKIGCSFINIHFKLYNNYKENENFFSKKYKDIEIGNIYLCVKKSIKQKYFYKKKNFYFVRRFYQLLHGYNEQFFFQPHICLNSVIKNKNNYNMLSTSNFYHFFKNEKKNFINNIEDLFPPSKKYYSIINHYCTYIKL